LGAAAGIPRLRLVLAVSLDGRLAPPTGGAAQLGGPGDRRALEEALAWADGALVGAQTLRLHGSTCLIHHPDLLEHRRLRGLDPQPLALAVSRSGQLPPELPFFRQPLQRWLLAPSPAAAVGAAPLPPGFDRQLSLDGWRPLLRQLASLGLERLVLLGGAQLAGSLLAEDLVEELQLTLCPRLLGGGHTWLPSSCALPSAGPWRLIESRDLGDGELLLRYGRGAQGAGAVPPA
jgi:5-amino-6-(5-phosphoribosylamino)uracil reductase